MLCIFSSTFAQTGFPRGPVFFEINDNDDEFQGIFEKVDDGYILVTGHRAFINMESSIHDKKLHFYTGKLGRVWTKEIEPNFEAGNEDWRIVTSKKFIYHIASPHIPGKSLEQHITQFTRYGEKVSKVFFDDDVHRAYYTDDAFLYETKVGDDTDFKLNTYDHATLTQTTYAFDLPSITDKEGFYKNKRWNFLGFWKGDQYFYKKIVSIENSPRQTYEYDILKVSKEGEVKDRMKIKAGLGQYYVCPTNNPHLGQTRPADDYKKKVTSANKLNMACFGDIMMQDEFIYIYGQYSASEPGNSSSYDGVFMQKYSIDGSVEWRTKQAFPSKILAKDPFLAKCPTEEYGKRVVNLVIDKHSKDIRYELVLHTTKKGNNRAYVSKWDKEGEFKNTVRGINKPRSYMRNRTFNDDPYTYLRNYEYDDYYEPGMPENTDGEDRFQELANLTPGLNIATYEYLSFPIGEIVLEKLHERKAVVFYFVKRKDQVE